MTMTPVTDKTDSSVEAHPYGSDGVERVSDERLAEMLESARRLELAEWVSAWTELIASRARIAELVGEVERAKRWADQAAQSASHWKIACFNAERELATLTGGQP